MTNPVAVKPKPSASDLPPGVSTIRGRGKKRAIGLAAGPENHFGEHGGSKSDAFNITMVREVLSTLRLPDAKSDPDSQSRGVQAALAAMRAFKPTDEIEGMLAAQAVAMHHSAMDCFRRANIVEQPADIATKLRRDGANLARGMTEMLDALDRKRGKGPQVVRVERVVVHEGGQAIVGNIQSGTSLKPGEG